MFLQGVASIRLMRGVQRLYSNFRRIASSASARPQTNKQSQGTAGDLKAPLANPDPFQEARFHRRTLGLPYIMGSHGRTPLPPPLSNWRHWEEDQEVGNRSSPNRNL